VTFVVREYVEDSGRIPFRDWLSKLDATTRARVQARILRFEMGNLGDHKDLLTGGDKKSQAKDIKRARAFWAEYVKELKHGKA